MEKKLPAVSYQLSAKTHLTYSILVSAISLLFIFTLHAQVHAAGKGTLTIPKRPGTGEPAKDKKSETPAMVKDIQEKYAAIKDIKGNFTQKSYIKDLEDTQEYEGSFSILKPSNMMWEYAAPRDEKVFINDLNTLIYKKSQNQVIKTRFSKEAYSQVPIALLASLENVEQDFSIKVTGDNSIQLTPKRRLGFIKTLVIETIQGDMPIKMFTIFDTYGNIIMIELQGVKTNSGLDKSAFSFEIPAGAEVYDMNQ